MKLLFCYDGPVKKDEKNNYYGSALNDDVFKRYECISNNINICIRIRQINSLESINKFKKINTDKYNIIECPNISSIRGIILNKKKLKEILYKKIIETDIVIIRMPSFIGNEAVKICNKLNKNYLIELVGCPWDALWNCGLKGKIIAPYMFFKTRKNVKYAPYALYVTSKFLQKRYPTKGVNIACSDVSLGKMENQVIQMRNQKIKTMNNKKIILGTVAAIDVSYKGQKYVIKALAKLKKDGYNNFEYQLVGGGKPNKILEIAKKYNMLDKIKIIGPLPHEKIFEWLDNIDIYIQPSDTEGLSRALIEAMSRGCPCIASDAGGNNELLVDKYIFKKKNINDLIKKLKQLLIDDEMKKQSMINFNKSKEYNNECLDRQRLFFYQQIINSIKTHNL